MPGDIVLLSAGDMIPADLRLISAKDLFINQSTLTGEAMPVEKIAARPCRQRGDAVRSAEHLLHGQRNVVSGIGSGVVVLHRRAHGFGQLAARDRRAARSDRASTRASTGSPG